MTIDRHIEDRTDKVKVDVAVEGKRGEVDFNLLKSGGIIKQRQKDLYTVRLRCPGGRLPLKKLKKVTEIAERYGGEYVHLSFRQSLEIPYVNFKDFAKIQKELREVDQEIASCGPRVRVPTACSGCEYNPNGLTDTQKMAQMVDGKFFGKWNLAHKFKISFSGCPMDCARTNEMDLGFQGAVKPKWEEGPCTGCRVCAAACTEGAIESDPESGRPIYEHEHCLYCGDCIRTCPTEAWQAEKVGWMVRCAGKHGRHPVTGHKIAEFVTDDDISNIIQAVLGWYTEQGKGQGRMRISGILQQPDKWKSFITHLRNAIGDKILPNPKPPERNEIHFER